MFKIKYLTLLYIFSHFTNSSQTNSGEKIYLCSEELFSCRCFYKNRKDLFSVSVNCVNKNITTNLYNLTLPFYINELDLSYNNISSIGENEIFISKNLVTLHLKHNYIEYIANEAFAGLPNLIGLDLSYNRLVNIKIGMFHGITKLEYLNLAYNLLKSFETHTFLYLPALKTLNLNYNNLGDFLESSGNKFFEIDGLSINNKLENLHLANNSISFIPKNFYLSAFNLKSLILSKNLIAFVPNLTNTIEYLDVSFTPISTFRTSDFESVPNLKILKANNLYNMVDIEDDVFVPLKSLEYLSLEDCKNLSHINSHSFGSIIFDQSTESTSYSIKRVSFMGSGLTKLDEKLSLVFTNLTSIDIRGNPWSCDCHLTWLLHSNYNILHKGFVRCYYPKHLEYQWMFSLKDTDFICHRNLDYLAWLIINGIILLCLILSGLATWLVFIWPKRYASSHQESQQYSQINIEPNRAEVYYKF